MDDLITYLIEETRPGDEVELDLVRPNGKTETVTVILGKWPGADNTSGEANK